MPSSIFLSFRNSKLYTLFLIFFTLNVFISLFIGNGLLGKFFIFINISNSMSPTISRNDLVIVQKKDSKTYKVGDIISFNSDKFGYDGIITHRIVSVENGQFTTKGDANPSPDKQHVIPIQIKGVLISIIPYVGVWITSVNTMIGKMLFLIVPMVIIIISETKNIQQYSNSKK